MIVNVQCLFAAWGSLNSRRATSLLVKLVEGEKSWEAPEHSQDVLPRNCGGTEQNRTVICIILKATANDRRKNLALCQDEFLWP
ncbi:uncharacterized protein TNCV_2100291 [Trichonephila clavipes]|nr:uncharacterized protein TNCV_2100291 [Trichonephila clavipes]